MEKKVYRFVTLYERSYLDRSFATRNAACRYIVEVFDEYGLKPISYKRVQTITTDFTDLVDSVLTFNPSFYE